MNIDLESLGMTTECLADRVVDRIAHMILDGTADDYYTDKIEKKLSALVAQQIDAKIQAIAEEHLFPKINEKIEGYVVQATNQYGEAKGEPKTFAEYLCGQAENYLMEELDSNGRSREKCKKDDVYWRESDKHTTRIIQVIDRYLTMHINDAMEKATKSVGKVISDALDKTVTDTLKDMAEKVSVTLQTKR